MNQDFRDRVLLPIAMPLLAVVAFVGVAFWLSRVLLALPEAASTALGITVAAYVLFIAAWVSSRPRITSRALGVGLVLGLGGVVAAGVVAGAAGMRPLHEEEVAAGQEGSPRAEEPAAGEAIPPGALVFASRQLEFTQAPASAPAGQVTVALENEGGIPHNVTFEGVNSDQPVVETQGNETATGTVTLPAGTVTYYCSVPGHRQAGMQGQLTVG